MATSPSANSLQAGFDRIKVLVESMSRQTHAGATMLVAAALDRLLESALQTKFSRDNRETRDSVFGEYGVLRDFSAKITMSFALGVIDRETQKRLTAIRRLRNFFAHTRDYINFESELVRALVSKEFGSAVPISSIAELISIAEEIELEILKTAKLPQQPTVGKLKDIL